MAGVKGKSGRRPWDKEVKLKELWDLSVPVLKRALKSNEVNAEKKIEIALYLVGKLTPKQIDHSGKIEGGETKIIIIRADEAKEKKGNRISASKR